MKDQIDAQALLDAVINQRNEALNKLAQITAYAKQLEEKLRQQTEPSFEDEVAK